MSVELEPLLNRLASYAPLFGRLEGDLTAMVSRGRAEDFKGVMQNARLVLEALLRSLVTEDLKQTPGKAMLDELITKFRSQANQGVVPTTILAHMGTVQAWGNLSSHDHAGSLQDPGVSVGKDEVVASLNSMLAVLSWFATKRGLMREPSLAPPTVVVASAPTETMPGSAGQRTALPFVVSAVGLVTLLGLGAFAIRKPEPEMTPFAGLDALYASWKEPPPPPSCRRAEDARQLAGIATDLTALAVVDPNPESAYLHARVLFERNKVRPEVLSTALACPNFAAALNLAGRVAHEEKQFGDARKAFRAALDAAPDFLNARLNLAVEAAFSDDLKAAREQLEQLIKMNPDFGEAYLALANIDQLEGNRESAKTNNCKAAERGVERAKAKCKGTGDVP